MEQVTSHSGKSAGIPPEDYSEEVERIRWKEIQESNEKRVTERNGVSIFLALTDDECHELIPSSHHQWRTPFEHDVLLPQAMKDQGVPYTPSWNRSDPLPGQVAVRLKPGEALIRNGNNIHTGHTVPERERNTLSIGWSKWSGESTGEPSVADARNAWQLDPAIRDALPHRFMQTAWTGGQKPRNSEARLRTGTPDMTSRRLNLERSPDGALNWNAKLPQQATPGKLSKLLFKHHGSAQT